MCNVNEKEKKIIIVWLYHNIFLMNIPHIYIYENYIYHISKSIVIYKILKFYYNYYIKYNINII